MPTSNMMRVRTVVTGVAGSPYYMVGYFSFVDGGAQAAVDAWHAFCAPSVGSVPALTTWTTEGAVEIVNPVSGDIEGVVQASSQVTLGTATTPYMPPTNQILIRWRTGVFAGGREIRGRTNIPFAFQDGADSRGKPLGATITSYSARATTLVNSGASFVIWSKKNGVWENVESGSAWDQYSVLRSRRD